VVVEEVVDTQHLIMLMLQVVDQVVEEVVLVVNQEDQVILLQLVLLKETMEVIQEIRLEAEVVEELLQ
tara:strand:+ start:186 stop:389 length:204 start_codon:yes stop_codon:yes gene_type:complete